MDVEEVDVGDRARDDAPGDGAAQDALVQAGAGVGREQLGVAQAGNGPGGVEDDGGGRHGAGETARPDLVDAGHRLVTGAPQRVLEVAAGGQPRRRARPGAMATGQQTGLGEPALPTARLVGPGCVRARPTRA